MSPDQSKKKGRSRKWILFPLLAVILLWPLGIFMYYGSKKNTKLHRCVYPEKQHAILLSLDKAKRIYWLGTYEGDSTALHANRYLRRELDDLLHKGDVFCFNEKQAHFLVIRQGKVKFDSADFKK